MRGEMKRVSLDDIRGMAGDKNPGDKEGGGRGSPVFLLSWSKLGKRNTMIGRHDGRFARFLPKEERTEVFDSYEEASSWIGGDPDRKREVYVCFVLEGTTEPMDLDEDDEDYLADSEVVAMRLNWPLDDWIPGNQYAVREEKRKKNKKGTYSYVIANVVNLTARHCEYIAEEEK